MTIHTDWNSTWGKVNWFGSQAHTQVCLLLKNGANIKITDIYEQTPLMHAVLSNHLKTVTALIEAGATLNAQDKNNWTALMHAAEIGNFKIVQALLEAGADITLKNNKQETAFQLAARGKTLFALDLLLKNGANLIPQAQELLWISATTGDEDIVRLLLKNNVDTTISDAQGWTALLHAEFNGHTRIANLLKKASLRKIIIEKKISYKRTKFPFSLEESIKKIVAFQTSKLLGHKPQTR